MSVIGTENALSVRVMLIVSISSHSARTLAVRELVRGKDDVLMKTACAHKGQAVRAATAVSPSRLRQAAIHLQSRIDAS